MFINLKCAAGPGDQFVGGGIWVSFWATFCGGKIVWPLLKILTVSTNGWTNCLATIENPNCLCKWVDKLFGHY